MFSIKKCLPILCIVGISGIMSCAVTKRSPVDVEGDSQDLVRVQIEAGDEWFLKDLAIYGIDDYKKIRSANIVLRPTLVRKDGVLQPMVPKSLSEAVYEIRKALPRWYLNQLEWKSDNAHTYCASDELMTDAMIVRWMIYDWELENWGHDDIVMREDQDWRAQYTASVIFEQLCP